MNIIYTEEFELSLKQIFILQEMFSFPDHEISYGNYNHDYLHRSAYKRYTSQIDEEISTHNDYCKLRHLGLTEQSDSGAEGVYFQCKISEKGLKIFPQIQNVDTSSLHYLRPTKQNT